MALITNIAAYYEFNNGAIITDSAGSFTLTNSNGVNGTASGIIGFGADFGASNTNKAFTQTGFTFNAYPITIAGWFNPAVVNNDGNIFSLAKLAGPDYYQFKLRASDSHIVFRSNNATQAADVDTGITATTSAWFQYAVVINSTVSVDLYVNGSNTNTAAAIFIAAGLNNLSIGALGRTTPLQFYSGLQDEIGYWTRALSGSEVSQLYNGGVGLQYPFTGTTNNSNFFLFM